jgi:hypothetical protein
MYNFTLLQLLATVTGQREIFQAICSDIVRAENPGAYEIREAPGESSNAFGHLLGMMPRSSGLFPFHTRSASS